MQMHSVEAAADQDRTAARPHRAQLALPGRARARRALHTAVVTSCRAALLGMAANAGAAAAPKAYVGLFKDSAVAVLEMSTNRLLSTIPVPPGPHGLVITPDGRKVY